ncbi:hypothetical protein [Rhabdothermincola sediminis]|uniref:hypothetical protein n=1 Tax=Rhabdothermincola sediminis TaxID=2751370 RepID=UPI001AA08A5E|nr:hypothetical protein [Rhabdothermincola sediminis]
MRPARLLIPIAVPFSFVLGHLAGFAVAHDDSSAKQPVEAGHEYLASLGRLAIPLLVASMFLALWSGMRGRAVAPRYGPTASQLVGVFVSVELVEHLALGWSVTHILTEPALWVGVLTQFVVAAALVVVLHLLVRVGELLASRGRRAWALVGSPVTRAPRPLVHAIELTPISRRGPPLGRLARVCS